MKNKPKTWTASGTEFGIRYCEWSCPYFEKIGGIKHYEFDTIPYKCLLTGKLIKCDTLWYLADCKG